MIRSLATLVMAATLAVPFVATATAQHYEHGRGGYYHDNTGAIVGGALLGLGLGALLGGALVPPPPVVYAPPPYYYYRYGPPPYYAYPYAPPPPVYYGN